MTSFIDTRTASSSFPTVNDFEILIDDIPFKGKHRHHTSHVSSQPQQTQMPIPLICHVHGIVLVNRFYILTEGASIKP